MEELKYEIPKSMEITQYNDKCLLLTGNTKPYKEELKAMKARFNYGLGGLDISSPQPQEVRGIRRPAHGQAGETVGVVLIGKPITANEPYIASGKHPPKKY